MTRTLCVLLLAVPILLAGGGTGLPGTAVADERLVFRPDDYGARGDGRSDDTEAFKAMHAAIIAAQARDPSARFTIELGAAGAERSKRWYVYRWNRWTWGIRDLVLEGNGATIQNLSESEWTIEQTTLRTNRDAFHTQGYTEDEAQNDWTDYGRFGAAIATARAGSTHVDLKDARRAGDFAVGKWAIVASYDQQGNGYPPNPRYYDWVRVTRIEGGRIGFDGQPLAHEHRDDLPDRADWEEPSLPVRQLIDDAVIVPAEREIPWGERWVIRNLTTAENPYVRGGAADAWGTLQLDSVAHVVLENVETNFLVVAMTQDVLIRGSRINSGELDKINGRIRFENSTLHYSEATGVERVEVVDSVVTGRIRTLARASLFDRVIFDFTDTDPVYRGALYIEGPTPVYRLDIRNSRFIGSPAGDEAAFVTYEPTIEHTIGTKDLVLEGPDLIVPPVSGMWDVGMNAIYQGSEIGLFTPNGTAKGCGRVRRIRDAGALQTARIAVDWIGAQPAAGDRVQIYEVTEIYGENNTLVDAKLYEALHGVARMTWNGEEILAGPCPRR